MNNFFQGPQTSIVFCLFCVIASNVPKLGNTWHRTAPFLLYTIPYHVAPVQLCLCSLVGEIDPKPQILKCWNFELRIAEWNTKRRRSICSATIPSTSAWIPQRPRLSIWGCGEMASGKLPSGLHTHQEGVPLPCWFLDRAQGLLWPHGRRTLPSHYCKTLKNRRQYYKRNFVLKKTKLGFNSLAMHCFNLDHN